MEKQPVSSQAVWGQAACPQFDISTPALTDSASGNSN